MEEKPKNNKLCDFFKDITIQKVIVFLLIATIGILIFNLYCQSAKIEGLNEKIEKLSALNNSHLKSDAQAIFQSSFKDDLVLNSFSSSITIIIAFFTTLIALAAVFSFKKIDQEINYLKETMKEVQDAKLIASHTLEKTLNIANDLNSKILKENLNRKSLSLELKQFNRINFLIQNNNIFKDTLAELLLEIIMYELEIISFHQINNITRDEIIFEDETFEIILDNAVKILLKEYDKYGKRVPHSTSKFYASSIKEFITDVENSKRKIKISNTINSIKLFYDIDI